MHTKLASSGLPSKAMVGRRSDNQTDRRRRVLGERSPGALKGPRYVRGDVRGEAQDVQSQEGQTLLCLSLDPWLRIRTVRSHPRHLPPSCRLPPRAAALSSVPPPLSTSFSSALPSSSNFAHELSGCVEAAVSAAAACKHQRWRRRSTLACQGVLHRLGSTSRPRRRRACPQCQSFQWYVHSTPFYHGE